MPKKPVDSYDIETEILPFLEGVEGGNGSWQAWCPLHDDIGSEHKGYSLTRMGKRNLGNCRSPHCAKKLPVLIDWIESGGASNGREELPVDFPVTVHRVKASSATQSKRNGMDWWVAKTQIPLEIWEELGVQEFERTGVSFAFDGFDPPIFKFRKPPKDMGWRGTDEWSAPPLWPTPPDEMPSHVSITEGESDCGTARFCGLAEAYAATKGAKADFPPGMFEALRSRGVTEVTLCPDADESGSQFSDGGSSQAMAAGLSVNVIRLELVIDPFAGVNDLNGVYKVAGSVEKFREEITRATQRVSSQFPPRTVREMDVLAEEEDNWMLPGLISPADKVLISGPPKSYKTWLSLDLARALATGTAFCKRDEWVPEMPVKVLLVQEEGSKQKWARRIRRLNIPDEFKDNLHTIHRMGVRFTESSLIDELIGYCREHEIEVIIFDPMQRMIPGVNENDAAETGIVWDEIFRLQLSVQDLVCVVVAHANKTETLTLGSTRGSGRHGGEVDLGLLIDRHPIEDDTIRLVVEGRDIPHYLGTGESFNARVQISSDEEDPFFEIDATEISVRVNQVKAMASKNKDSVLVAIDDGCTTVSSIASQTEISDNTVRKYLKELQDAELVEEEDHGEGKAKTYRVREDSIGPTEEGEEE